MSELVKTRIIRKALLSRRVEEALLNLFAEGKLYGTVHTCIGQEFSGAVVSEVVEDGDTVFSNHRCHGHFVSVVGDVEGMIAEILGKETGVCAGRGGSQHLCKNGFYSNGIQGGIVPVATGLAFGHQLHGKKRISVCFIGDGTLGEGALYESMNIAAKWRLPLLIVLENNGYAQSTHQDQTLAGDILARAQAFGIPTFSGDTWEWERLLDVAKAASEIPRSGAGPAFLRIDTFRLKAHSKGDDDRPRDMIASFEGRDPLNLLLADEASLLSQALLSEVEWVVAEAVKKAVEAPYPKAPADPLAVAHETLNWEARPELTKQRFVKALNEAYGKALEKSPETLFIGEDIESPYGGAFKVTAGLSTRFPERVRNTPISEAAIAGIGTGLAMGGRRPFVEVMFGDFSTLVFDQLLNHAAKFPFMYNEQVPMNLVIRTPMGGGRGYGPTHSQCLEKHFLGTCGLKVAALNGLLDPGIVTDRLTGGFHGPVLLVENKLLYARPIGEKQPVGFDLQVSNQALPTVWIKPRSAAVDLTLIAYGGLGDILLSVCQKLFEDHDLIAQALIPTQLYPFDVRPLLSVLRYAPRVVLVEEGQTFAGFGAELVAQLAEHGDDLGLSVKRLGPPGYPVPASGPLEQQILPITAEGIIARIMGDANG